MLTLAHSSKITQPKLAPPEKKLVIVNAKSLQGLRAPKTGVLAVPVQGVPGLQLLITPLDLRTWSWRYTNAQGLQRRLRLGELTSKFGLAEAKAAVAAAKARLNEGKDPAEVREERREAITFGALAAAWASEHAYKLTDKGAQTLEYFDRHLAHWKHRVVNELTKADLLPVFTALSQAGTLGAANHLKKHVSRVCNWGIETDKCKVNPAVGVKKHKTQGRKRVLDADELRRVYLAADTQTLHVAVWFKLRAVTGQRSAQLLRMRWADLNHMQKTFGPGWWLIPGELTKNGQDHLIYLSETARELLATLPRRAKDGPYDPVWVFPCGPTTNRKGAVVAGANTASSNVMGDYKKTARRLAQPGRANIVDTSVERTRDKRGVLNRAKADFGGHDLRRTMSTFLTGVGKIPRELVGKVLHHTDDEKADVTAVYDRYDYMDEKREVLELWEKQLTAILAGNDPATAGRCRFSMDAGAAAGESAELLALRAIVKAEASRLTPTSRAVVAALGNIGT